MHKTTSQTSAAINAAYAISLAFLTGLVWLIFSTTENIPVWDAWHNPKLFDLMFSGKLQLSDLYEVINGHRLLFPKIIILILGYFSHYDVRWELVVNIFLGASIFSVYKIRAVDQLKSDHLLFIGATVCLSILVFSLVQYENWYFGWQICYFLCVAMSLLSLSMIVFVKDSYVILLLAILSAVIATYSFANGLIVWPLGLLVLLYQKNSRGFIIAWLAAGVLFISLYFRHFEGDTHFVIANLPGYIKYLLVYAGAPLAIESQFKAIIWAVVGIAVFLYLCLSLHKTPALHKNNLLLIIFCLFSLTAGLLISLARLDLGMEYALLSRYTSFSTIFWTSLCLMVFFKIAATPDVFEKRVMLFFIAMVLVSSLRSSLMAKEQFYIHHKRMILAINELKKEDFNNIHRDAVKSITWDVDFTLKQALILKKYKLSLYAE